MKWVYEISDKERRTMRPEDIIVGVDRIDFRYITLDKIFGVEEPPDLREVKTQYK